jgi:hypothetical protein
MTDAERLVAFINARLDEDEQTASMATDGPWVARSTEVGWCVDVDPITRGIYVFGPSDTPAVDIWHVARQNPLRILRGVAAKRGIIQDWLGENAPSYPSLSDDELHIARRHPAYEYATTEGQRKAWDYSHVPPEGDGWERNITSDDDEGWERFSYTEESYWRRLRPQGPRVWNPPTPRHLQRLASEWSDHPDFEEEWSIDE